MTGTPTPKPAPRIGLTDAVRLLAGIVFVVNGLNWWVKLITPYPSMSDFVDFLPPPDVVGAMIENGVLFHLVKATELGVGIALLTNRFVPLALVAALPLAVPVFVVDVFFIAHLRGQVMGWGTLILNLYLLLAYLGNYHAILQPGNTPSLATRRDGIASESPPARLLAGIMEPLVLPLGLLGLVLGAVMVVWLGVMIAQHALNPMALSDLFPLQPRVG